MPKSDLRSSKLIDGVVWDGSNPKAYAEGFKIKARVPPKALAPQGLRAPFLNDGATHERHSP